MLISINWIKDFVELPEIQPDDLGNDITMAIAEVEDVLQSGAHLQKIQVAQIKSLRKHPEADKLNLVTFDLGNGQTSEVVCGAPNVREGLKIPYAPIGTTLPGGFTLEPKKIRGVLSNGMLCSEKELGLGEGSSGLMELPDSAVLGQSLAEYLGQEADTIIDIDNKSLTHRPDLWGHYGFSREIAALYAKKLRLPFEKKWFDSIESKFTNDKAPLSVQVDTSSAVEAFWGLSIDNILVEPSPKWMQQRLNSCGMRPINNIVDISNYVMLELGIPNHIYDRNLIEGTELKVHRLNKEDKFTTLDEVERHLISTDTVICDSQKPLIIAGIMGGANSGVNERTKNIFLECANWKATEIRQTSTRLGLRTDSSQRYEKSLDSLLCYRTLLRMAELILKLCPGAKIVGKPVYDGIDLSSIKQLTLITSALSITSVLGKELSEEKIISIFESLDFGVESSSGKLKVTIPSYRTTKDIDCEADLIEEIGRIIGYDNIEESAPKTLVLPVRLGHVKSLQRRVQDFMSLQAGSLEILTYPMIGEKLLNKAEWPVLNDELTLINALSIENDRMRPSLVPTFLEAVSLNQKNFDSFSLFEIGRSYLPDSKDFRKERNQLIFGYYSKKSNPFINAVNTTEKLLNFLSLPFDLSTDEGKHENPVLPRKWSGIHPYEFLNIKIMGRFMGAVSSVHPLMLRNFKIKGNLSLVIIDFVDVESKPLKEKTKYTPLQKFPSATFDCTVVMDKALYASVALKALSKIKIKELVSTKIVDTFELDEARKSVTLRSVFSDPNQTVPGEVLKAAENSIVQTLAAAGFPLKQ